MHMNLMKRMLSLLLALALLVGNVPAVAFAEETEIPAETEMVAAEETLAPTEAETEPAASTEAATEPAETVIPTEVITEPTVEETVAPTQPAVPEETVAPTEIADEAVVEMQWHTIVPDVDLPDNEELHAAYIEQVLYDNRISTLGIAAGNRLSGDEKLLYDALVPYIKEIANGERASTVISVGQQVGEEYIPDEKVTFSETYETDAAVSETVSHAITALLSDLPFEMYWYDKTAGCSYGYLLDKYGNLLYLVFTFPAAVNYAGSGNGTVNTEKTGAAAEAVHNAESIISEYASSSDYEKLVGYRDEICKLVSYNHDAAGTGDFSGNDDPWQLIYVFDGDPNTNVVCEGYSKAFMYLCDLTDFAGDVTCYTVSGLMNGGGHMWNIVTIGGSNYMADVTNSDDGSVGMYGGLFLVGGAGSAAEGYSFIGVEYTYDNETKSLWSTGADSILTLASEDYDPNAGGVDENIVASGTCGDNLTWKLDKEGTLTISGTGEMYDYVASSETASGFTHPWGEHTASVVNLIIMDGVTSIGEYAFAYCLNLNKLAIPDSITDIGIAAFLNCSSLENVSLPSNLHRIDWCVFSDCINLGQVAIPESVMQIGLGAFFRCTSLTEVSIPNSVTIIESQAFQECHSLTNIVIPDSVETIERYAFQDCSGLKTVVIGSGLETIGKGAFDGCVALQSFSVSEDNLHYADRDGVLYNKGYTTLVQYPSSKNGVEYTVPSSVIELAGYAFRGSVYLKAISVPDTTTTIGEYAFYDCEKVESVILPSGLTMLSARVFSGCKSLTDIEIPDGVTCIGNYAFANCVSLESVNIPNSVTSISEGAFENCSGLTSIVIPDSVTSVGSYAFAGCSSLTSITFEGDAPVIGGTALSGVMATAYYPADNTTWTADVMQNYGGTITWVKMAETIASGTCGDNLTWTLDDEGTLTISGSGEMDDYIYSSETATKPNTPWADHTEAITKVVIVDGVASIGTYAFYDCTNLKNVALPDSLISIDKDAFGKCIGLTSVDIPGNTMSIGSSAFASCTGLTSVTIPNSVTSIGQAAFIACSSLTSVTIPGSIISMGSQVFDSCSGLKSVTILNGVTSVVDWMFFRCTNLTSIEIPDSVTSIGERAFDGCTGLTSIEIPDGVTGIGHYAFVDCTGLTSIELPHSLTGIGNMVFGYCSGLTSVVIPDGITSIGIQAFDSCASLKSITFPASLTSIGEWAFYGCSGLTEIIFEGSAPEIDDTAFQNVCAKVYYPADDSTWTEDRRVDYDGILTWVPKCKTHSVITQPAVAPTCTTDGLTEGSYCVNCGEVFEAQQTIPALGHTEVIEEAVAATCTTSGLTEGKHCSVCGEILAAQKYVNVLGHDMGDWTVITEATCGTDGLRTRECQREGCVYTEEQVIACAGHKMVDGECTNCGYVEILNSGTCGENLTWTLDGKYTLTISGTGATEDYTASANAPWYDYRTEITAIIIESGVAAIGSYAFHGCNSAASIVIPDGVTAIGRYAFLDCEGLTELNLPATVNAIDKGAFRGCKGFTDITIPASVKAIGMEAFGSCKNLTTVTFEGDAPEFVKPEGYEEQSIFGEQAIVAYYPTNNPTWTEDVMQNYGGNITWEAYGEVEDEPELPVITGDSFVVDFQGAEYLQYLFTPAEDGNYLFYFDTWGGIGFSVCKNDNEEWIECGSWDNPETGDRGISAYLLAGVEYRITVHDKYGEGLNETIYVAKAVSYDNIWIETEDSICYVDNKVYLKLRGTPELALERAEWTVSDPSVLEIYNSDATNLHMYSLAPGTVTVTVTTESDKTASIEVTVLDAPPSGTCGENLTWVLDKEGTLTISGTGEMTTNPWGDSYCEAIKTVVIEDGVTSISRDAFRGCSNLTSVTIADSVTDIVGSAFYECTGLRSITIPSGVKSIGSHTFCKCSNLESVLIENGVETIGPYVFALCNNLKNVVIPDSVVSIGEYAFSWCKSLEEITLPDSIATIGNGAFLKCNSLREIVIPDGVTEIAEGLLEECYSLSSVALPDSITSIGNHAFYRCNLTNITIPSGVTSIGETAFLQCENLTEVIFEGDAPIMASNAFMDVTATAYYPANNPTWTADVMQNYGGTITWKPYGEPQVLPKPVVNAAGNPVTGGGTLSWEDDSEADYYQIYRATSKNGKYKLLETVEGTELEVKVSVGKTYYYKVKAICDADASLNSGYSSVVKVTGKCAQPEIDAAVKPSSGKPVVKWSKVSGAKKYDVYRATAIDGTYKKVKTTTSTSYTDSKATLGTTYYYKVKAIASKSTYNSVFSEIDFCLTILAQPDTELSINKTTGKPVIEWEKVSGAIGYEILRAESEEGEYTKLANRTELTFEDSTAEPDKDYWYKVNAIGASENLNNSGDAEMIHATLAKPAVSFGVNSITGKPVLTWEEVDGAVEYKIYRSSKSKESYKCIETTTDLSYSDDSVKAGKGYYYKVIAIGENCKSAYSSYKKLTAKCARPEITAIGADLSSGKPTVKWDKVSGAKKYYVYRATEIDGEYEKVKSTTKTSYTDTKAKLGTEYFYKVKAIASKSSYNSIESVIRSCLTILAQPVVTAKNDAATGNPILSWKTVTGAVGYEIYCSVDEGEFTYITTQTELTYTDESAVVDGKYTYKVKAVAENGDLNSVDYEAETVTAACEMPSISIALDGKKPMVSWEAVEGATKYYVYRSTKKSSGYKKVATLELEDGTSYRDSKAKKGTTYYYKIVAVSENTKSAYSNVVKIKSK